MNRGLEPSIGDDEELSEWEAINHQIQVLNELNRRIVLMESQLRTLHGHRRALETDIAIRRASISPNYIQRLPIEILVKIFEHVVHCDHSSYLQETTCGAPRIRDLMLVCRSWRNVVANSPLLWRRICVIADRVQSEVDWVAQMNQYLDVWLPRSKDVPLIITIDLRDLMDFNTYMEHQLNEAFERFVPLEVLESYAFELCGSSSPLFIHYYRMYRDIVKRTLGLNRGGFNAARCHTLNLRLTEDPCLMEQLWHLFDFPMPKLRRLLLWSNAEYFDEEKLNRQMHMTSLTALTVAGEFTLNYIPLLSNLQELELSIRSWEGIENLNRLQGLQSLCIRTAFQTDTPPPVNVISLPQLRHLHLQDSFPAELLQLFHLTDLPKLTLEDNRHHPPSFPDADLFHEVDHLVYMTHLPWFAEPRLDANIMEQVFLDIFPQLMKVHTIGVPGSMRDAALRIADRCKSNQSLPFLQCVQVVDASGDIAGRSYAFDDII